MNLWMEFRLWTINISKNTAEGRSIELAFHSPSNDSIWRCSKKFENGRLPHNTVASWYSLEHIKALPRYSDTPLLTLTRFRSQATAWYSSRGSPTFSISGIVHFRSKAFERTILNICIRGQHSHQTDQATLTYLLDVDAVTRAAKDETCSHRFRKSSCLIADLFLIFAGKFYKMIVFGANQEGNSCLVEAATLSVPFFDAV